MHPEGLGHLPDPAEVEPLGHGDEPRVDRADGGLEGAVVATGFVGVVLGAPTLRIVILWAEATVVEGAPRGSGRGVDTLVQAMAGVQPVREGEDLVGGAGLEPAGPAGGEVGVVVHAAPVVPGGLHLGVLAVVLVLRHGEDPAAADLDAGDDSAHVPAGAGLRHVFVHRRDRRVLNVEVEGGVHVEAAAADVLDPGILVGAENGVVRQDMDHVVAEVRVCPGGLASGAGLMDGRLDGGRHGLIELDLGDLAVSEHLPEDVVAALPVVLVTIGRTIGLAGRPVEPELARIVHDGDEAGRLCHREAGRRAPVVVGGRGLDAVHAAAEAGDVEVLAQDVVFCVLLLHADRQSHLLEFARRRRHRGRRVAV